ncbi:MAG TPA: amidase family protein [Vicinamibacterales bacterium]
MNIWQQPAVELARQLRERRISAREVVRAFLARIDAINPHVNAIVTLVADQAMEQARLADERIARGEAIGPLHGLPIAHKDLQETAGIRTTFGSSACRDYVPTSDAPIVAQLKRSGAITVGKTNTPELGAGSQTFNRVFGATLNPYDLTKTCGGSSGGAAVALACGMLPIADGTDMGGSLRNPAAFCGVVGLRPTSRVGTTAPDWQLLSLDGPMARTSADVALLWSAITAAPLSPLDRSFRGCRIAWSMRFAQLPFDPRIVAVVDAQRRVFEALGCAVEDADADCAGADEAFKTLRAQAFVSRHGEFIRRHRSEIKDTILEELDRGERLTTEEIARARQLRSQLRERLARFFDKYEFIVLPTTQAPPFDVNQPFVREIAGVTMTSYIDWMKSCYFISVAGHPAISVPAGLMAGGLPVGLQIVGRDGDDWNVLRLAHAFECARGPFPMPAIPGSLG